LRASRLILFGLIVLALILTGTPLTSVEAAAGDLDPTFGSGGKVTTDFGNGGDNANAIAIQSDGKSVAAGFSSASGGGSDFALARYNLNGTLDVSFGTGGKVTTDFGSSHDSARAVAIQSDGKLVVAGYRGDILSSEDFALARYNLNGTLDTSFGAAGTVLSSSLPNGITALGLDAAGNIFTLPVRAEFSPTGQADAGVTPAPITASSRGGSSAFLPSGQFVQATGVTVAKHDVDVQVQRFNADGSLASASPAFDYSGAAGLDQAIDGAGAVAVQANGQAVAGGAHFLSTSPFGLARVNPDGTLDAGFGSGGVLTTTFNGNEAVEAVLTQPDGKIIAAGFSEDNTTGQSFIALARYNP